MSLLLECYSNSFQPDAPRRSIHEITESSGASMDSFLLLNVLIVEIDGEFIVEVECCRSRV